MVSTLFEVGRLDILKQIQSGMLTPLQVYEAYRVNELQKLPTAATLKPLREAMESWIAKKECSEAHRRSLRQSLRHLHPSTGTSVGQLPGLLVSLRDEMQGKHPRSFNMARAAAQAFVKSTQGRTSNLWSEITNIEVLKVTPQRLKHPLTIGELRTVRDRLPLVHGHILWGMVFSGMGPTEYWGKWEIGAEDREDRILIHGTKRAGRERVVPLVAYPFPPAVLYPAFRRALRDASDGQVRPYDLRRTYANFLESAGIPRTRRKLYLGHGSTDVTSLYEWHEVDKFLVEDAAKLRAYVFGAESTGLKLEKA